MTQEDFLWLFRYVAWADQRVVESLKRCAAAREEATPLFAHLLAAEHVWLSRLQGVVPRYPIWPELSWEECLGLTRENERGYREYLAAPNEMDLQREVHYQTSTGQSWSTTVADILMQVVTHGPYHRGQIAKIIGRHQGQALNTDYITFVRESRGTSIQS